VRLHADTTVFRDLPAVPFKPCEKRASKVSSTALVRYRSNDYSVPTAFGLLPPPPVDGQDDVPYSVVDVSGDVDNERAEQLLPCAHGDIWRISRGIEIVCKSSKVGWFDGLI
jgi:hypothetical protein